MVGCASILIPQQGFFYTTNMVNLLLQRFTNGAIALAILANASSNPLILPSRNGIEGGVFEADLHDTALVAKTPLDEGRRRMTVHLTAYSSTFDQTDDTPLITAAGTRVRDGIVAANFLPLYTRIKIPELFGEKVFVVEDRMAKRFQDRVDLWFPDRASAKKFGIKTAEIVVL